MGGIRLAEPPETLETGTDDSDLQRTPSVPGADVENEPIPLATEVPLIVKKGRVTILTLEIDLHGADILVYHSVSRTSYPGA